MFNLIMRPFILFIFLSLNSFITSAQKVECRNDSIFVNGFYITASTSKSTLDGLLQDKGKIREQWGHNSTDRIKMIDYIYNKLGLIFRKYEYDSIKFSIVIKLSKNSNFTTQLFKGDLFFANSHINKIKRIDQVQEQLKDCKFKFYTQPIKVAGFPLAGAYAVTVSYQNSSMYMVSDFFIDEITSVFIN